MSLFYKIQIRETDFIKMQIRGTAFTFSQCHCDLFIEDLSIGGMYYAMG